MIRLSTVLKRATAAIMLGSLILLAGCHTGGTKGVTTASMKSQFDLTIKSYKDSQFLLDGAVLSAVDLGSHFAYLKDQGKLPQTVLLVPSDDSKIKKEHLRFLARLQLDYGFRVYYDHKGELVRINPTDTKPKKLEDTKPKRSAPVPEEQSHFSPASGG